MLVVAIVALVETIIRLGGDFQVALLRPFYPSPPILALAIVGPIAMWWDLYRQGRKATRREPAARRSRHTTPRRDAFKRGPAAPNRVAVLSVVAGIVAYVAAAVGISARLHLEGESAYWMSFGVLCLLLVLVGWARYLRLRGMGGVGARDRVVRPGHRAGDVRIRSLAAAGRRCGPAPLRRSSGGRGRCARAHPGLPVARNAADPQ